MNLCQQAHYAAAMTRLLGTSSDVAPILWQNGALARLEKGEKIDKLLYGGYSTISLGYAGLYEMCLYMTGKSHTDEEAKPFALAVMQKLNDKCAEWRAAGKYRLFRIWNTAGIHNVQICKMLTEAFWHNRRCDGPQLYHKQLSCERP